MICLLLAACGSPARSATVADSPHPEAVTVSPSPEAASPSPGSQVATSSSRYGRILVDRSGRTLYLFDIEFDAVVKCYGACAASWPPFLAASASASTSDPNLKRGLIGVSNRSDGPPQVTYNGHPLYYYVGDGSPGDIKCQAVIEFGGGWYVIDVNGDKIGKA